MTLLRDFSSSYSGFFLILKASSAKYCDMFFVTIDMVSSHGQVGARGKLS